MNRVERLTAILLLVQGRKRTAGELAARFEVSRRTILRDMQALSEMGLPDYSLTPLALRSVIRLRSGAPPCALVGPRAVARRTV